MKTFQPLSRLLKSMLLPLLAAVFFCSADKAETPVPPTGATTATTEGPDTDADQPPAPEKAARILKKKKRKEDSTATRPVPVDPGWIGDCYYYAEGGYYHQDGVYWCPDLKTHYVYAEECWYLANDGILTATGVYYPPMAAPDGIFGIPWRLAAVISSLVAGPPQNPGRPPDPPERESEP